jgi:hypothetical protein
MPPFRLASLYRYPVKGLSPEPLREAWLAPGGYFPGDRMFAIENGPSGFDPARPEHQPKIRYLMLMRNERLARLRTRYDDRSEILFIDCDGREAVRGEVASDAGRAAIEAFFAGFMQDELRGPPKWLAAPGGYRFTDSRRGFVSLINLASVAAIEARLDRPVDPLRFRGNLLVEGIDAWAEFDLVGKRLRFPGGAALCVTKRIERCAATNVDPATGFRDLDIPRTLLNGWGHTDCGVYAEVVAEGTIRPGERIAVEDEAAQERALPF